MRIGFLTPLYIPDCGGAEILLDRLARSLVARGHRVVVVAPRLNRGTSSHLPYPAVRTVRPISKRFGQHFVLPPLLYAWYKHRFEVLHCHGEYRAAVVGRTFRRLTGIPYVVRALGGGFRTVEGHPRLHRRVVAALSGADGLIAQGAFLEKRILDHGGDPRKLHTIHNGVDLDEIAVDGPTPRPFPYILYVGGLRHVKGYDVLLNAFARIRQAVDPVRLILAGNSQQEEHFRRLCRDLNLGPDALEFTGPLGRSELALFYQHALCYVCPFRQSPFSNANLEAMAAGLPIVATAVDGNTQQIHDGVEGFLVPPDDAAALGAALQRICEDPELRERMGGAARKRSRDFEWAKMVDMYESLYREIAVNAQSAR